MGNEIEKLRLEIKNSLEAIVRKKLDDFPGKAVVDLEFTNDRTWGCPIAVPTVNVSIDDACSGNCQDHICSDDGGCCQDEPDSWIPDDGNSVMRCPYDCGNYKMLNTYCQNGNRKTSSRGTVLDRDPCDKFCRR